MFDQLEFYPPDFEQDDSILYYVEFHKWEDQDEIRYRLFKRQFYCSKEEWIKNHPQDGWMRREVHPWQLHNGIVNERVGAVDFETKEFLKFVVDSLNKNTK